MFSFYDTFPAGHTQKTELYECSHSSFFAHKAPRPRRAPMAADGPLDQLPLADLRADGALDEDDGLPRLRVWDAYTTLEELCQDKAAHSWVSALYLHDT